MRSFRPFCVPVAASLFVACGADVRPSFTSPEEALQTQRSAATAERGYSIHPQSDTDLCFSVAGGKDEAGAAVELAACTGGNEQRFARYGKQLKIFGDKCLQVKGGQGADGAPIVIDSCTDDVAASDFTLTASQFTWGAGAATVKCVDVTNGVYKAGTLVQLWTCSTPVGSNDHQQFYVLEAGTASAAAPGEAAKLGSTAVPAPVRPAAGSSAKPEPTERKPLEGATPVTLPPASPAVFSKQVFGPAPSGVLVAPYFFDWGSDTGFATSLVDAHNKGSVKGATIAFGLSGGGCAVSGFSSLQSDIAAFEKAGGTVVLSFGGADGTYLQSSCQTPADLAQAILTQIQTYATHFIDFDIEGNNLNDAASNAALLDALVTVQEHDTQVHISFTLPVDPDSGLPENALALLKAAAQKGVRVGRVNVMAMDYGRKPANGKTAGDFAISAAQATFAQMKAIWPSASDSAVYHAIGITPMIGQNDGDTDAPFLPSDATKVATWAKQNGIGLLAYWALQRDLAATGDYNDHSNNQGFDYAFYKAFSAAQ